MEHSEDTNDYATVIANAFKQYSLKRGMKELGGRGYMAVTEEMSQLYMRDKFCPKSYEHLTKEQKWDALESLIFLKVNRYGIVKGLT